MKNIEIPTSADFKKNGKHYTYYITNNVDFYVKLTNDLKIIKKCKNADGFVCFMDTIDGIITVYDNQI